jgi:CBS domain containing-hemolysin-like protein
MTFRNASATEALPVFLSELVPEFIAVILSVTAVLLFGEIIPASILTGFDFHSLCRE